MTSENVIGRRVRAARALAGMDATRDLARRIDLSGLGEKVIGQIERGERQLQRHERAVIAEATGVPESFLSDDALGGPGQAGVMDRLNEIAAERAELASMVTRRLDALEARMTELLEAHEVLMTERWSSTEVALRQAVVVETAARLEELARRSSTPGEPPRRSATPRTAGKGAREPKS